MTTRTLNLATTRKTFSLGGILAWLIEADRRHRMAHHLRQMPQERLDDIGLTRDQASELAREL